MPTGWRKASYSGQNAGCVEVGRVGGGAAVRDTKDRAAGYLTATRDQWARFIEAINTDRYR
ncbi:DUF397 domain-containing protein [Saccharopolyspora sp. CA-218241]|uniref:DUF397 domain-containing protein n=1 Tax=Saccharopolyspora sp. CA-218241 TaxID=3240027 RepID=UPI003D98428B